MKDAQLRVCLLLVLLCPAHRAVMRHTRLLLLIVHADLPLTVMRDAPNCFCKCPCCPAPPGAVMRDTLGAMDGAMQSLQLIQAQEKAKLERQVAAALETKRQRKEALEKQHAEQVGRRLGGCCCGMHCTVQDLQPLCNSCVPLDL